MAPTAMSSPPATMTTVWLIASTPRMVMPRPILSRLRAGKEHVAAQRAEDQDEHGKRDQQADVVDAEAIDDQRRRGRVRCLVCGRYLVDAVHWIGPPR